MHAVKQIRHSVVVGSSKLSNAYYQSKQTEVTYAKAHQTSSLFELNGRSDQKHTNTFFNHFLLYSHPLWAFIWSDAHFITAAALNSHLNKWRALQRIVWPLHRQRHNNTQPVITGRNTVCERGMEEQEGEQEGAMQENRNSLERGKKKREGRKGGQTQWMSAT